MKADSSQAENALIAASGQFQRDLPLTDKCFLVLFFKKELLPFLFA
jgi:hypothetical protein